MLGGTYLGASQLGGILSTGSGGIAEPAATIVKPTAQESSHGIAIATVKVTGTNMASMIATALPAGLTLAKVSEVEWTIKGTPTTVKGVTSVTLEAKNAEGAGESKSFNWTVVEPTFTPGVGTYKFKIKAGSPYTKFEAYAAKNATGEQMYATITNVQGYGTNDPAEAYLLNNVFGHVFEEE